MSVSLRTAREPLPAEPVRAKPLLEATSLSALLRPRSVAIIGASATPGTILNSDCFYRVVNARQVPSKAMSQLWPSEIFNFCEVNFPGALR